LAKQHPSLRKTNIAKRMLKTSNTPKVDKTEVKEVKSVVIKGNQLIITF
jgi:hypothetical protein